MKRIVLSILFVVFALAAQAQLAYSGDNVRAVREAENTALHVFPNPAVDYISISSSQSVQHITVYNLLGRKMKSFTYTEGDRYFIGDLPKGMYLVQMTGKDARLISTQRLSKR